MKKRRIKRLLIEPELVWQALSGKGKVTLSGIPEDAVLVNVTHDWQSGQFCLFLESATFPELGHGEVPPLLTPEVEVTP